MTAKQRQALKRFAAAASNLADAFEPAPVKSSVKAKPKAKPKSPVARNGMGKDGKQKRG